MSAARNSQHPGQRRSLLLPAQSSFGTSAGRDLYSHRVLHRFQPKPFRFRARAIWPPCRNTLNRLGLIHSTIRQSCRPSSRSREQAWPEPELRRVRWRDHRRPHRWAGPLSAASVPGRMMVPLQIRSSCFSCLELGGRHICRPRALTFPSGMKNPIFKKFRNSASINKTDSAGNRLVRYSGRAVTSASPLLRLPTFVLKSKSTPPPRGSPPRGGEEFDKVHIADSHCAVGYGLGAPCSAFSDRIYVDPW